MADVSVNSESNNPSELLGQGIKAFVLQDFEASVAALSRASELLVQEHEGNDLHDSLGEVYLYYGKALLGLSREQNEALGDAVPKDEESEDDEGIENEEEDNAENEQNEQNAKNKKGDEKAQEKPAEGENEKSDKNNKEGSEAANGESKEVEKNGEAKTANGDSAVVNGEAGPSSSNPEEPDSTEDASQDDEATDLQVAWEVLELAKQIYQRQGEDSKKKLADTLIVLGEVSLESENFDSAINDIKEGLEIQKSLFSEDSRTVAETYYKLGVAYSTDSQMTGAIENFEMSLQYLRNRINVLEKDPTTEENKEEIEEIKALIPDIEEKIADMKSSKEEAIKKITEAIKIPTSDGAGPSSSSSSSKPASDISHLVKRKRKSDEADGKEEVPAKKPATAPETQ